MGISFKNVSHRYSTSLKNQFNVAIDDINFSIESTNEFVALVGKTGSGKSTLIQHMNALLLPTEGEVDVCGNIITPKKNKNPKLKNIRKKVGFVFQFPEYQLFEETVIKDIMFAPLNFGDTIDVAKAKAIEAAKLVNINENLLEKSPFNLSGGQMRKCAVAGILSYDPDILLLDEPTRGLDPKAAEDIMKLFYDIHKKYNKTIILISHDMNIVYQYASRVIVMNSGKVVFDGDKVELFSSNVYKENHLTKPDVLKMIDFLNEKMGYTIDYNTFTEEELFDKVVKLHE